MELLNLIFFWIASNTMPFVWYWFYLIVVVLAAALKWPKRFDKAIFTILGMLGTFLGLVAGLWTFDNQNMDESILTLINGMKLAFLTSIWGIVASLVYSWKQSSAKHENNLSLLKKIEENTEKISRCIQHAFSDDQDNSIVNQIKLLKTDLNDNHKKTIEVMQEFFKNVSLSSTDAIVKALENVVINFNEKITNQFGEHFKHLNEAVGKLVIWQEEYKEYLESFKNNLNTADDIVKQNTEHIKDVSAKMQEISIHTQHIPKHLSDLTEILSIQENEKNTLSNLLVSFSEIKEKASNAIPEIQNLVHKLMEEISIEIGIITDDLANNFKNQNENLSKTIANVISLSEEKKQELFDVILGTSDVIKKELNISLGNIEGMMRQVFETSDENVKKQVKDVIEQMGAELTSISQHLVNDYRNFCESMRKAVEIQQEKLSMDKNP